MTPFDDSLDLSVRIDYPKFSLKVEHQVALDGVTALVGESGAGKSTLLRIIAGLEQSAVGHVRFRGRVWMNSETGEFVPAYRRAVGIVFQEGRLFSHLDVTGNLNYGFRRKRGRKGPQWDEVCGYLDLGPLQGRRVHNLSGGEQQRVALGRALLSAPELLLLDEPLASLDNDSKEEIIPYLRTVISKLRIPAVYISHSREELRTLVDRFLTVKDGRTVDGLDGEVGAGQRQLLSATVDRTLDEGLVLCRVDGREILARTDGASDEGASVILAFLDSDVAVNRADGSNDFNVGSLPAHIDRVESGKFGWEALVELSTKGGTVMTRLNLRPEDLAGLSRGQCVELSFVRMPQILS